MKSHVTMEQHVCIVCGKTYDTGNILLDTRLRQRFDQHTLTGNGLCPEHKKLFDEGFVALVAVDPSKSKETNGTIKPGDEYRTGVIAHLRRTAFSHIINIPIADTCPMVYVDSQVIEKLQGMVKP